MAKSNRSKKSKKSLKRREPLIPAMNERYSRGRGAGVHDKTVKQKRLKERRAEKQRLRRLYNEARRNGLRPTIDERMVDPRQLKMGIWIESEEHTTDLKLAKKIALHHLAEDPTYYDHLIEMEKRYAKKNPGSRSLAAGRYGVYLIVPTLEHETTGRRTTTKTTGTSTYAFRRQEYGDRISRTWASLYQEAYDFIRSHLLHDAQSQIYGGSIEILIYRVDQNGETELTSNDLRKRA